MEDKDSYSSSHRSFTLASRIFVFLLVIYLVSALLNSTTNVVGGIGQFINIKGRFFMGWVIWIIPMTITYWLFEQYLIAPKFKKESPQWQKFLGLGILIFGLSTLVTLMIRPDAENIHFESGILGFWFADVLAHSIGHLGGIFICIVLIIASFSLIMSVKWQELFYQTGEYFLKLKSSAISEDDDLINTGDSCSNTNLDTSKPSRKIRLKLSNLLQRIKETFKKLSFLIFWQDKAHCNNEQNHSNSSANTRLNEDELNDFANLYKLPEKNFITEENDQLSLKTTDNYTKEENQHSILRKGEKVLEVENPQISKKELPPLDLLDSNVVEVIAFSDEELSEMGNLLEKNLLNFNIEVKIEAIKPGPVVTLFELSLAPGIKVNQIVLLTKDLARALSVVSVRVIEVIIGKPYIGVEIPNNARETVNFHQLISSPEFQQSKQPLTLVLGKDIGGLPVIIDLAKTPHLLVAGTTGSGKSVGVNAMILSILFKSLSDDVKMILIDPKMLELSVYENIPHLLTSVVTDMADASAALKWAVAEMERRYKLMSLLGVRNIIGFNEKIINAEKRGEGIKDPLFKQAANYGMGEAVEAPNLEKLPYIVVVIDEFADLMMVVGKQIEELIARLAQKARAAGIHLILATQRPSVNVITGLIKANIPTRVAFQVSTKIDSRTILDQGGAEQLLGLGDMLYLAPGKGTPIRVHGAFVSDTEVHQTVDWLKNNNDKPIYIENLTNDDNLSEETLTFGEKQEGQDEFFDAAWEVVFNTGKASISRIQRELRIGYNRAARLIEEMEEQGLVSAPDDRGQREILARKSEQ